MERTRNIRRWISCLCALGLAGAVVIGISCWRMHRSHSADLAEELEAIFSDPPPTVEWNANSFETALTILARKRQISQTVLRAEFADFSTGGILGLLPGGYREALASFSEHRFATALEEARALLTSVDSKGNVTPTAARAATIAAAIEVQDGALSEAERHYRIALSGLAAEADRRAMVQMRLADVLERQQHRRQEAIAAWRAALEICDHEKGAEHVDPTRALSRLASSVLEDDPAETEHLLRRAELWFAAGHPLSPMDECYIYGLLADAIQRLGRNSEAIPIYKRSLAAGEKQWGATSPSLVRVLMHLENALQAVERFDEAESVCRRAMPMVETEDPTYAAYYCDYYATLLRSLNRSVEAERTYLHALNLCSRAHNADVEASSILNNLGALLRHEGRLAESEQYLRRGLALLDRAVPPDDPRRGVGLSNLGLVLTSSGRAEEGETFLRRAVSLELRHPDTYAAKLITALNNLADALLEQNRPNDAEPFVLQALDFWKKDPFAPKASAEALDALRDKYLVCLKSKGLSAREAREKCDAAIASAIASGKPAGKPTPP